MTVSALFSGTFTEERPSSRTNTPSFPGAPFDGPLDVTSTDAKSTDVVSSGPATASDAGLIFGAAVFLISGSAGPGFTARKVLNGNVTEDESGGPGPVQATFTNPNLGQPWIAQMAVFR